jgi:hypothetical protein
LADAQPRAPLDSFGVPGRFIAVPPQSGTGGCDQFGAAAFNEIARLGDNALQDFEDFARAGFVVNEFRERRDS